MENIKHKIIKYNLIMFALVCLLSSCTNRLRFTVGSEKTGETVVYMHTDFPEEEPWTEQYLKDSIECLVQLFNNPEISPPVSIKVTIEKDSKFNGVAGAASSRTLYYKSNKWTKDSLRLWILLHELTNLFAAHYGGTGGYPSDWWSDDRSPFPEYVSCLVMEKLGYEQESRWRKNVHAEKPDHELYWKLHEKYGFSIFERFFKLLREDKIDFGFIGQPWPKPDVNRSLYTAAYLSMAAGVNITDMLIEHDVGKKPSDWDSRHPEILFVEYSLNPEDVQRIIKIREILIQSKKQDFYDKAMELYRSGDYPAAEKVLNSN